MTLLALETSTPNASLALWREGAVVREWAFHSDRAHNSLIFAPLAEALELDTPDLIAVGTGPGSYAGVRVAIAAGLGLAMARGIPLLGWPSLTACDLPDGSLIAGDARRGESFVAEVSDGRIGAGPEIVAAAALALRIGDRPVWTFDEVLPVSQAVRLTPTAGWLARRVAALPAEERVRLAADTPEPLYLRAPFITTPKPVKTGAGGRGAARVGRDFG